MSKQKAKGATNKGADTQQAKSIRVGAEQQATGQEPVSHESARLLAMQIGGRQAARRLGIKESTLLSWSHREKWNLPKRKGWTPAVVARTSATPAEALIAENADLEEVTREGIKVVIARAVQAAAKSDKPLPIDTARGLVDSVTAAAKVYGWEKNAGTNVNVGVQVAVVSPDKQAELQAKLAAYHERQRIERPAQAQRDRLIREREIAAHKAETNVPYKGEAAPANTFTPAEKPKVKDSYLSPTISFEEARRRQAMEHVNALERDYRERQDASRSCGYGD